MSARNTVFVGRKEELSTLEKVLTTAEQGTLQICLIEGDAGDGKTALVEYFAESAQKRDPTLSYAIGTCDVSMGGRDLYAPFKDIFAQLTGLRARNIESFMAPDREFGAGRLIGFTISILKEFTPELIGTLVPGAALLSKLALSAGDKVIQRRLQTGEDRDNQVEHEEILRQSVVFFEKRTGNDKTLILIFDDIQWLDQLSYELLGHLTKKLSATSLLLILMYRPTDLAGAEIASRLVSDLKLIPGTQHINLRKSRKNRGREFVERFMEGHNCQVDTSFIDEFYRRTDGRPLFAVELLRFLKDARVLVPNALGVWEKSPEAPDWKQLPHRNTLFDTLIESRLNQLDEQMREMLTIASVEGYEFTAQVIAEETGMEERTILRLLSNVLGREQDLVREVSEERIGNRVLSRFRFTNVCYQEHIYNNIGMGEKRWLHGEIAQTLESLYGEDSTQIASLLSHHYYLGKKWEKAVDYLIELGLQQASNAQYGDAQVTLLRALAIAREVDYTCGIIDALRFLVVKFHLAKGSRENYLEAQTLLEECISRARKVGEQGALSFALRAEGRVLTFLNRNTEAMYSYMESLSIAKQMGDKQSIAAALNNIGVLAGIENRFEDAYRYGEMRLKLDEEMQSDSGRVIAYMNLADRRRMIAIKESRPGDLTKAEELIIKAKEINARLVNFSRAIGIKLTHARINIGQGKKHSAANLIHVALVDACERDIPRRITQGLLAFIDLMLAFDPENPVVVNAVRFVCVKGIASQRKGAARLADKLSEQQKRQLSVTEQQGAVDTTDEMLSKVFPILEHIISTDEQAPPVN